MHTCDQVPIALMGLLPTRHQLEEFLQTQGYSRRLEQLSTWEQIQLTHEYQCWVKNQRV
jgi:hypothetical protein